MCEYNCHHILCASWHIAWHYTSVPSNCLTRTGPIVSVAVIHTTHYCNDIVHHTVHAWCRLLSHDDSVALIHFTRHCNAASVTKIPITRNSLQFMRYFCDVDSHHTFIKCNDNIMRTNPYSTWLELSSRNICVMTCVFTCQFCDVEPLHALWYQRTRDQSTNHAYHTWRLLSSHALRVMVLVITRHVCDMDSLHTFVHTVDTPTSHTVCDGNCTHAMYVWCQLSSHDSSVTSIHHTRNCNNVWYTCDDACIHPTRLSRRFTPHLAMTPFLKHTYILESKRGSYASKHAIWFNASRKYFSYLPVHSFLFSSVGIHAPFRVCKRRVILTSTTVAGSFSIAILLNPLTLDTFGVRLYSVEFAKSLD